ncbi:rhomboid family intramembrane serine protease [Calderihabitans maritimus]|uniref:Rhomboid family protein n=1 Tax=Calderihabitans maritimus TaxID=1246530 RepID=A0A1Z5HVY4_9FIRM|nr:rhomboid family intramembrane serine protease [Calderihabitans maritimus]GAW93696.1 Rhomboid family protein [Calderihabitans maritimus]
MIPLKDNIPSRRVPVVSLLLIGVNIAVFVYQLTLGPQVGEFIYSYGVVPKHFLSFHLWSEKLVRLTTAMFLHGGWFHLVGNMLYLWIFGDNVEDRMGHLRYLVFYLLTGYLATVAHILFNPYSPVPIIGASGAIAGVLGGYMILFPWARVLTLVPIFFFFQVIQVPALIFLGLWFFLQLFNGAFAITMFQATQGVAWWAHIGGFISGMILVRFFVKEKVYRFY